MNRLPPIEPDTPFSLNGSGSSRVPDTPIYERQIHSRTMVMATVHSEQIGQAVEFHIAQTAIASQNDEVKNDATKALRPSTIVVHHDKYAQQANNSLANSSIDPWIAFTSTIHYVSALWLGPIGASIFFIACTQWISPEHWRLIYNTVWYSAYAYMIWYPFDILYKNVLFHSADGVSSTFTCCKLRNRRRDGSNCCGCSCERQMTVTTLIRFVQILSVVLLVLLQLVKLYILSNEEMLQWWDLGIQCTTLMIFMIVHPVCMWRMIQTRQHLIIIRSGNEPKAAHTRRSVFSFRPSSRSSSSSSPAIIIPPYDHVPLTTDANGNLMINTKQILKENNLSVTLQNNEMQIHKTRSQDALPSNVQKLRQYHNSDDYREIVEEQCMIRWNSLVIICFLGWLILITLFVRHNDIFGYLMVAGCVTMILLSLAVLMCTPRPSTTFSISDMTLFVVLIPFLPLLFAGYIWDLYIHNTNYALALVAFLHFGHQVFDSFAEHLIERMSVKHLTTPLRYMTKLIHHVYTYAVFGVTQWGWQFIAIVLTTNVHDFLEATGMYGEGLVRCCRTARYPERHRLLLKLMSTAERMRLFYQLIVADVAGFIAVPLLFTAYTSSAASSTSTIMVMGSWADDLLKSGTMMESPYLVSQILLMICARIVTSILAMLVFRWQIRKLQREYDDTTQDDNKEEYRSMNDRLQSYLVDTLYSEFYARVCIIRYETLYPELFHEGGQYQQPLWSHLYISTSMQDHVKYYFLCTLLVMLRLLQPLVQFIVL